MRVPSRSPLPSLAGAAAFALLAAGAHAATPASAPTPPAAHPPAGGGERPCACADLPRLEQQLFQQEWLQHESRKYDTTDPVSEGGYYNAGSTDNFRKIIANCFNHYLKGDPDCSGPAAGGASDHGASVPGLDQNDLAAPELGTQLGDPTCPITTNVHDASVRAVSDGNGDVKTEPFDEKKYRNRPGQTGCKADNDFPIAHERQHQKTCKAAYKAGRGSDLDDPSFFAADDAKAYGVGIKVLRAAIAKLAKQCGWQGSTHDTKPSGDRPPGDGSPQSTVPVVPTPAEAKQLANALQNGRGK